MTTTEQALIDKTYLRTLPDAEINDTLKRLRQIASEAESVLNNTQKTIKALQNYIGERSRYQPSKKKKAVSAKW
jgi:hypothetical protein